LFFRRFKNQANEQMSGYTGMTGTLGPTGNIGPMGLDWTQPPPTGPSSEVLAMFPSPTNISSEPPHIVTIDELMSSYEATLAQELLDKTTLSILINPSREAFRPQLFQWAGAGFTDSYIIQTFSVNPPNICSDGVTRNVGKYIEYCIGTDLGSLVQSMAALMTGIKPSWSTSGNTLSIHVTRG
jgi:hypothetical protein